MIFQSLRKIFVFFILSRKFVNATDNSTYNIMLSSDDLKYFLNAIDYIALYVESNTTALHSPDLMFGLFLSNVNLKTIMRNKANFARVPQEINLQLSSISQRLDRLVLIYNATSYEFISQDTRLIYRLFTNTTRWSDQLPSFHLQYRRLAVVEDSPVHFAEMYGDYATYSAAVWDVENSNPTPGLSDECFFALTSYEHPTQKRRLKVCELPIACENVLRTGTDFGYALSHRILLLLIARLGVDCALLGKSQDEKLQLELCQEAYYEGRFIAMNGYEFIDLMMEYVAACSMLGYTEFLRRDWLEETLRHQTKSGCFYNPLIELEKNASKADHYTCEMHFTGVALAALGSAIRWILENEYAQDNIIYNDTKIVTLYFLRRIYDANSRHDQHKKLPEPRSFFFFND